MSAPRPAGSARQAILEAAIELLAHHGAGRITHRAIAAGAGVSLGTTTYHFPRLDGLVDEALAMAAARARESLAAWEDALRGAQDVPSTLVALAQWHVAEDRERTMLDYELYIEAARKPELRGLVAMWLDELARVLAPVADDTTAQAIAALLDGAMLAAVALDRPVSPAVLEPAVRQLLERGGRPPAS